MKCAGCGKEISDGMKFCKHCGSPVCQQAETRKEIENIKTCLQCGAKVKANNQFCTQCGMALVEVNNLVKETSRKKKRGKKAIVFVIITLLLSIGLIGVITLYYLPSEFWNRGKEQIVDSNNQNQFEQDETEKKDVISEDEEMEDSEENAKDDLIENEAVNMSCVERVSATSSLSENNMTHSAERVIDKNLSTAWVEGVSGQGIGEMITLFFDQDYVVSGIKINAGFQISSSLYEKNSRPAEIKISFSDGSEQVYVLQDVNGSQDIVLDQSVTTNYVSFTIRSVYYGTKYEDTVISEIEVY